MSLNASSSYRGLPAAASGRFAVLAFLFFLSGAAGLMFQVVWLYRLGLIFGNAVYATTATLTAFFLGLASGGWFWGKLVTRYRRPLLLYGLLELGIAATALFWLAGVAFYGRFYPDLVSSLPASRFVLILIKFLFSISLLFLPTSLMGGTFPVLVHYVGRVRVGIASRGTLLYALNTIGAAVGVIAAGFFLMARIGVSATYALATGLAAAVGLLAILLDMQPHRSPEPEPAAASSRTSRRKRTKAASGQARAHSISIQELTLLALCTGAFSLALETLWIRMFAQVLENSVYSFSAILVIFLLALGGGGMLAHWLVQKNMAARTVLQILLWVGAFLVALTPILFTGATRGLSYLAGNLSWFAYLTNVFKLSLIIVFPPMVLLGAVFPFLLKVAPDIAEAPGRVVGRLIFLNALGGALGPVFVALLLINVVGLWRGIQVLAVAYAGLTFFLGRPSPVSSRVKRLLPGLVPVVVLMLIFRSPVVRLSPGERLLGVWHGSDGVVSVVKAGDNLQMRLDNYYVLGDTRSALVEQMQGHLPLLLHPSPQRILFLGMGTGITAGAALAHPVERVLVVELIDNVIQAARQYFAPWVNGLFQHPAVRIIADDARNYLLGYPRQYEVIIGDLFTPWHAGTGSLYTVEHFRLVRSRLAPGGLFAQWLPMYQLTPESFYAIARSFATVFPTVTLWRADFSGTRATVALVGQEAGARLDQKTLKKNIQYVLGGQAKPGDNENLHMAGLFYMGNLQAVMDRVAAAPLNTDDRRTIEFLAPVVSQKANAGQASFIVGRELEKLLLTLYRNLPPDRDPYLSDLPQAERRYVEVGLLYYRYLYARAAGDTLRAGKLMERLQNLAPGFLKSK